MGLYANSAPVDVIIATWPWGAYLGDESAGKGIRAKVSSWRRISPGGAIPHAKASGSYLNSILAKTESANAGYDEAILLDERGFVCEGSGENIFVVREGEILTPPHTASILDGINRKSVIQIARDLGYTVVERDIARAELYLAEEVFLTGTAAEMVPVREIDDHAIGGPGEITRHIQAKFMDALHGRAEEYLEWLDFVDVGDADAPTGRAPTGPPPTRRSGELPLPPSGRRGRDCRAPRASAGPTRSLRTRKAVQMEQVKLYDTTLRDGMQGEGMSLSAAEKARVVQALDGLGVGMIEAGFPSSNPKEEELFARARRAGAGARRRLRLRDDPPARDRGRRRPGAPHPGRLLRAGRHPGRQDLGAPPGEGDQGLAARRTWR